tara:strand:- start:211 stop:585 length:375 start_codon:yes stop_codon:yes gene_type:complete
MNPNRIQHESKMNSQFTIRLDNVTNKKTIESAKSLNITRATLVRNALTSYLDKQNPNQDSEIVSLLKEQLAKSQAQLEAATESRTRSDTIIMQLSKQIERQHLQIEDITKPKPFLTKLKALITN